MIVYFPRNIRSRPCKTIQAACVASSTAEVDKVVVRVNRVYRDRNAGSICWGWFLHVHLLHPLRHACLRNSGNAVRESCDSVLPCASLKRHFFVAQRQTPSGGKSPKHCSFFQRKNIESLVCRLSILQVFPRIFRADASIPSNARRLDYRLLLWAGATAVSTGLKASTVV
jgi:hypothetical protein